QQQAMWFSRSLRSQRSLSTISAVARLLKQGAEETLRKLVQRFVRGFGLLNETQTPCGQPIKTSQAHALMILLQVEGDGIHQAALAKKLGIDKSNVSRLIRQLAAKGHV